MSTGPTKPTTALPANVPGTDNTGGSIGSLNIRNYMDMYITNQFMSQMSSMMNAGQMDFMVIFYIILLSSINEIKVFLKTFLDLVIEKGSEIMKKIPESCMRWRSFKWKKNVVAEIKQQEQNGEDKQHAIAIELKPNLTTVKSLMTYLRKNPSICSSHKSNKYDVEVQNLNEMKITETLSNIKISLKNFNVEILNDFKLDYTISKSKNILADYSIGISADNKSSKITSLTELIDDLVMRKQFVAFFDKIKALYPLEDSFSEINDIATSYVYGYVYNAKNLKAQKYIMENYKNPYELVSDAMFYNEIFLMLSVYQSMAQTGHAYRFYSYDAKYCAVIFGMKIAFPANLLSFYGIPLSVAFADTCKGYLTSVITLQASVDFSTTDWGTETDNDDDDEFIPDTLSIKIHSSVLNEAILYDEFMDWFGKLNEYSEFIEKRDKVTMNYLSLDRIVEVKEITNPEYEAYLEKRKLISGEGSDDTDSDSAADENPPAKKNGKKKKGGKIGRRKSGGFASSMMMAEMFKESVPAKVIKETHIHKKIKCQEISEISKNFSTLYLRESDTFKLEHSLETFYSKKELFEELGLQHKLGVLLYGPPGTGKTSTIYAIGTYLKKNLFYINLNDIETNAELQIIFDYVNKNCINGGIIIFEDIDAMTKIVHKRSVESGKEERDMTVSEIVSSKNDKLTLEYFLNLLQGSLTQTGTIYIATTNHLEMLDPAFYRDGRFDVKIEMKKCDRYQINMIYKNFYKRNIPEELLGRISEDVWTPANIIFHIKNFMFGSYTDAEILAYFINSK